MNEFFNAAVLFKVNSPLQKVKLKIPKLNKYQVLVKLYYTSVCKSQLMEIYDGRNNRKWLPHLLGHEASGEVISTGNGVKSFKKNDKVILTWIKTNLKESDNPIYKLKNKKINSGKVTTFSEYTVVSQNRIVKKPKKLMMKEATLLGCCFLTGPGMVFNQLKPKKNQKILLVGLGSVGLGVLLALKYLGIKNITIVDNNKNKLKIAKMFGYKKFLSNLSGDKKNFSKFDLCYETSGSEKMIEKAFSSIKNTGTVLFASHPNEKKYIKLKPFDFIQGKKLFGSWGGCANSKRDVKKFSNIIISNRKILKKILCKEYSFNNINNAIIDYKNGKIFKPIINLLKN